MLNHSYSVSDAIDIELDNQSWSPHLAKPSRIHRKSGSEGYNGYKGGGSNSKSRSNSKSKPKDGPWKEKQDNQRMEEEAMIVMTSARMGMPRVPRRPRCRVITKWVHATRGQATKLVRAIVVHGIACSRQAIKKITDDMNNILFGISVVGARWLLPESRRVKPHSSVVIYLDRDLQMLETEQHVILHGTKRLVEEYEFKRKRK